MRASVWVIGLGGGCFFAAQVVNVLCTYRDNLWSQMYIGCESV